MSEKRITFIINPVAGGRGKEDLASTVRKKFVSPEFAVKILFTQYPSHAFSFAAAEVASGTDIVVAVGGDGTINEVARALINTPSALGIIPVGSGNGFARHFNFPLSVRKSLQILNRGKKVNIDVGYVNNRPFFCTSGVGFDAETGYYFSHYEKRGFLSYMLSFFSVFRNYRSRIYQLEIDGRLQTFEAFFINIANISQFGYHFYIAPGASARDGALDLVVVRKFPKWKGLVLALQSLTGTIDKSKYVYQRKSGKITLMGEEERIIHIDGDPELVKGKLEYRVEPQSLKVILP